MRDAPRQYQRRTKGRTVNPQEQAARKLTPAEKLYVEWVEETIDRPLENFAAEKIAALESQLSQARSELVTEKERADGNFASCERIKGKFSQLQNDYDKAEAGLDRLRYENEALVESNQCNFADKQKAELALSQARSALSCAACEIAELNEANRERKRVSAMTDDSPERGVLEEIRAVACGETQLEDCENDTEALVWIFRKTGQVLRPKSEDSWEETRRALSQAQAANKRLLDAFNRVCVLSDSNPLNPALRDVGGILRAALKEG